MSEPASFTSALAERATELLAGEGGELLLAGDRLDEPTAALTAAGWRVTALARGAEEARRLRSAGAAAVVEDGDELLAGAPEAEGGWAAVVLWEAGARLAPPDGPLARARSLLAPQGRLLVAGAVAPTPHEGPGDGSTGSAGHVAGDEAERGAAAADPGRPAEAQLPTAPALVRALYETAYAVVEREAAGDGAVRAASGDRPARLLLLGRAAEHRVRAYREGDERAILDLFRRVFQKERGEAHWRWEYDGNPLGNRRISLAFAPGGELVAQYAGYPARFHLALPGRPGRTVSALHIGDTMTAPEVRRVGRGSTSLLVRTVRHFYAAYCEGRLGFNYGFNTGKVHRFYKRAVDNERFEQVPYRVRELPGEPFPVPRGLRARLAGWRVERVERFDERFDDLFRRVRGDYGLLVVRDARWLAWRYGECPDVEYATWAVSRRGRMVGWGVFRREEGPAGPEGPEEPRLVWGDALFERGRPEAVALLLAHAAASPEGREAVRIEGWFPARPAWWGEVLDGLGVVARPEPQDLGLVYVPFLYDPGPDSPEHLYYTKGDSDLF